MCSKYGCNNNCIECPDTTIQFYKLIKAKVITNVIAALAEGVEDDKAHSLTRPLELKP